MLRDKGRVPRKASATMAEAEGQVEGRGVPHGAERLADRTRDAQGDARARGPRHHDPVVAHAPALAGLVDQALLHGFEGGHVFLGRGVDLARLVDREGHLVLAPLGQGQHRLQDRAHLGPLGSGERVAPRLREGRLVLAGHAPPHALQAIAELRRDLVHASAQVFGHGPDLGARGLAQGPRRREVGIEGHPEQGEDREAHEGEDEPNPKGHARGAPREEPCAHADSLKGVSWEIF